MSCGLSRLSVFWVWRDLSRGPKLILIALESGAVLWYLYVPGETPCRVWLMFLQPESCTPSSLT
jgi:hypothetical protein